MKRSRRVSAANVDAAREIKMWSAAAVAIYSVAVIAYLFQFPWTKAWSVLGVTVLTGASAFALGLLLGFLFGLPRTLEDVESISRREIIMQAAGKIDAEHPWPVYRSNTNLEQISDWLTKILVGVGLIQLIRIPSGMESLGEWLKPALGDVASSEIFAIGLVLYNVIGGFLIGYLLTRLRMAQALSSAEASMRQEKAELQDAIRSISHGSKAERDKVDDEETKDEDRRPVSEDDRRAVSELKARVQTLEGAGGRLDADAYCILAYELKRAGKYVEAEDAYLKAAEMRPEDPVPLTYAGVLRGKYMGDYDRADKLYRKAIALDPTYTPAIYNLACNEKRRGRVREALTLLATAVSASPEKYRRMAREDEVWDDLRGDPLFISIIDNGTNGDSGDARK
ncbi:tetratricopeptide repeat protein [Streptomyces iakyrus]|uniref:tetratricopeptide repeat protein n=1 Tax=Streptomyces iakyrus TaxID=68219 RepID=UPI001428B949|nr:tetratricopeptide repeat protein [Streptomyces iakyrus]